MAGKWMNRLTALVHAWNAFDTLDAAGQQAPQIVTQNLGTSYTYQPQRNRPRIFNERTMIGSVYNRIAIDAASVVIKHVKVDENGLYQKDMVSALQDCLTVEANIDQGASQFRQDVIMTLFDHGVAAIVPVDTTLNPLITGGYDVQSMRVGQVLQWFPRHVTVRLYNDNKGIREDVTLPKAMVAIVENPLYTVMNEPNSTLQRLIRKLAILDDVDEQSASGKLDIIIQLPYVVKTETKREEAAKRLKEVEFQLKGSQYGIAYVDGTEKITQLNRPAENNLMAQVTYLVELLYSQLGITAEVMNGTALQPAMVNYYNRTIEPINRAITEAMKRTFLTKTARTQGQSIVAINDPFKLVTMADLAQLAEAFSRNEILTPNDFRAILGRPPASDPAANQLKNRNMPTPDQGALPPSDPSSGQGQLPAFSQPKAIGAAPT